MTTLRAWTATDASSTFSNPISPTPASPTGSSRAWSSRREARWITTSGSIGRRIRARPSARTSRLWNVNALP